MKKYLLTFLALVLISLVAPAQVTAADGEADQAITKLREGLVDSFNHGDMDRLLAHLVLAHPRQHGYLTE